MDEEKEAEKAKQFGLNYRARNGWSQGVPLPSLAPLCLNGKALVEALHRKVKL